MAFVLLTHSPFIETDPWTDSDTSPMAKRSSAAALMDTDPMDEVITEFITESHENLGQLDQDLVELEKDPRSTDRLASVFRTFHTMKGVAGFSISRGSKRSPTPPKIC